MAEPDGGRVRRLGGRLVRVVEQAPERTETRPPVVLLGGCGVPAYVWDTVATALRGRHVLRLQRPGLGSPWPGHLPTLAEEVATLRDLGTELGRPAVLVAHSMAGPHAEALARERPDLVRALVLVDSSVEWHPARSAEWAWLGAARAARVLMQARGLAPLGSLGDRILSSAQSRRLHWYDRRPEEVRRTFRTPDAVASVVAEQAAYGTQLADLARLRDRAPLPPSIGVVVLTAGGDGGPRWIADQARLARLLGATHVVLRDSLHLVMIDRPDAVVRAVGG